MCSRFTLALYVNHKYIGWIIGCLIAGYAVLLCIGNGYAPDDTNLLAIIDRNILGADHLYHKSPIDPEGFPYPFSFHSYLDASGNETII